MSEDVSEAVPEESQGEPPEPELDEQNTGYDEPSDEGVDDASGAVG